MVLVPVDPSVDVEELERAQLESGLFEHLSHKSMFGVFTPLDAPAGQCPSALARIVGSDPAQEYRVVVDRHAVDGEPALGIDHPVR